MRPMAVKTRPLLAAVLLLTLAACSTEASRQAAEPSPSASASTSPSAYCDLKAYLRVPHLASDSTYDASDYEGEPVDAARRLAASRKADVRVVGEDGKCFGRTDDFRGRSRVNFYVQDGVVVSAAHY